MRLITPYEPKIIQYMVPGTFNRVDFYGQAGIDVPPEPSGRARELRIIELLDDPSQTRFLTFSPVTVRDGHFADLIDERMYDQLRGTGEYPAWLSRATRSVPDGITVRTEPDKARFAVSIRADWWEVSW